jgi:hypothetical protein
MELQRHHRNAQAPESAVPTRCLFHKTVANKQGVLQLFACVVITLSVAVPSLVLVDHTQATVDSRRTSIVIKQRYEGYGTAVEVKNVASVAAGEHKRRTDSPVAAQATLSGPSLGGASPCALHWAVSST